MRLFRLVPGSCIQDVCSESSLASDMDKPGPGYWCNMQAHFVPARSVDLAVKRAYARLLFQCDYKTRNLLYVTHT